MRRGPRATLPANRTAIDAVLARNQAQAEAFRFPGTPAFIVGTFRVNGGLDAAGFKQVIAAARAARARRTRRLAGKPASPRMPVPA